MPTAGRRHERCLLWLGPPIAPGSLRKGRQFDNRRATQAIEDIEVQAVRTGFVGQHGHPADRAMPDGTHTRRHHITMPYGEILMAEAAGLQLRPIQDDREQDEGDTDRNDADDCLYGHSLIPSPEEFDSSAIHKSAGL
jgi:hypothetical protein